MSRRTPRPHPRSVSVSSEELDQEPGDRHHSGVEQDLQGTTIAMPPAPTSRSRDRRQVFSVSSEGERRQRRLTPVITGGEGRRRESSSISSEGGNEDGASTSARRQPLGGKHGQHNSVTFKVGVCRRPQRLSAQRSLSIEEEQSDPGNGDHLSMTFPKTHRSTRSVSEQRQPRQRKVGVVVGADGHHLQLPGHRQRRASMLEHDLSALEHSRAGLLGPLGARRNSRRASLSHSLFMFRQMLLQASQLNQRYHFRAYVRLALICIRLCEISRKNLEQERGDMLCLQLMRYLTSSIDKSGVFFDFTDFKADRQNHLSQEARRVLTTPPKNRTEHDIYYLLIALRNIAAFAEYPTRMQKKLCTVAWFESYESSRTIVREGDPPRAFYFILSGQVEVTKVDRQYGTTRVLVTLDQGMSFGELAVISNSRRQASVITQNYVELLCISGLDFEDIFMAGREIITDPVHDPFIRSVSFLRHWPVQHLSRHPQACMFHYFNRGQVLVRDSNNSDWIYIVKSGSLSVMKKLHHVNVTDDGLAETDGTCLRLSQNVMQKQKKRASVESPQVFRNSLEAARRLEQTLPGVFNVKDRLGVIDYDRIIGEYRSRIQPRGSTEPQSLILPEIPKHGAQCGSAPEALSETMAGQGQQLGKIDMAELEAEEGNGNGSAEQPEAAEMIRNRNAEPSYFGVDAALEERLKGVYLDSSDGTTTGSETNGQTSPKGSLAEQVFRMNIAYQRKFREHVGRKTMADQLDYKGARDFRYTEMDLNPMFVLVQVLEKGQYFGVSQLVSPEQPSLSLVSNGAELVVLSKKLFLDHCSDACMGYLRRTESPYPPEEKLQTNLQDYVNWEAHRTGLYSRQVSGLQEKQARRNQYVPRVPPGSYNFRSGEW